MVNTRGFALAAIAALAFISFQALAQIRNRPMCAQQRLQESFILLIPKN